MNNSAGVDAACNLIDIHLLYILYCLRRIGTLLEYIPLASRSPLSCGYMGYIQGLVWPKTPYLFGRRFESEDVVHTRLVISICAGRVHSTQRC